MSIREFLDNKFPSGLAGYSPVYSLTHPWVITIDFARKIKWAWQRVFRGWDDTVVWSVDTWFSEVMPEILKTLKENKAGIPCSMFEGLPYEDENSYTHSKESFEIAQKRWNDIMDKMIKGFLDYNLKGFGDPMPNTTKEAFRLFSKYFENLWD